jgi:hypothetical protein
MPFGLRYHGVPQSRQPNLRDSIQHNRRHREAVRTVLLGVVAASSIFAIVSVGPRAFGALWSSDKTQIAASGMALGLKPSVSELATGALR